MSMIRVIIVEDQAILRDSLAMAINAHDDMQVVATLSDAADVMGVVEQRKPELVLLDVCTEHDSSGIVAAQQVKEKYPDIRTVIMTGMPEITFVEQARKANADSFIYKNIGTDELISVLRSTVEGYSTFPHSAPLAEEFSVLNEEEVRILRLVCESKSRKEIADELFLSEGTVKRRISEILAKTGYSSIMKLAVRAVSEGYIVPQIAG